VGEILDRHGLDYALTWRPIAKPFTTPKGALVASLTAAIRETVGLEPRLSTSGGTSDGRFIAPYGVGVVEIGPINKTIHQVNEVVAVGDLDRLERIYFRIAELLLVG
jgi:succinyl-diaminopimelate desuccinylase